MGGGLVGAKRVVSLKRIEMNRIILGVQRDPHHAAASPEDLVALVARRRFSIDDCGAIRAVNKKAITLDIERRTWC